MILRLEEIYSRLLGRYGCLGWWPADSPFEVCVGAILTQNTNWINVEKAIANLRQADCLSLDGILRIAEGQLAVLIRPAGYFNVKARRLKDFVSFIENDCAGSLDAAFSGELEVVRSRLLKVKGIGPETADSMMLYAGQRPSFVVDAYTRRIFSRLGLVPENIGYDDLRNLFMSSLESDAGIFNQYHALIVEHAKRHCKAKPLCDKCCLGNVCCFGSKL